MMNCKRDGLESYVVLVRLFYYQIARKSQDFGHGISLPFFIYCP